MTKLDVDRVAKFRHELEELCSRHGFVLGHEDFHGMFILTEADDPMGWVHGQFALERGGALFYPEGY